MTPKERIDAVVQSCNDAGHEGKTYACPDCIASAISDIHGVPCEHRSADYGYRCSLQEGHEGEHHFSIAPPTEQAPWRIKDKLAAVERERDEALRDLAESDRLNNECVEAINKSLEAVERELSAAGDDLAHARTRIAELEAALRHTKGWVRSAQSNGTVDAVFWARMIDSIDAALSTTAQPATAAKCATPEAYCRCIEGTRECRHSAALLPSECEACKEENAAPPAPASREAREATITFSSYREDGWPLCPQCGEDELYVLANWPGMERPALSWFIERIDGCYRCNWKPIPDAVISSTHNKGK